MTTREPSVTFERIARVAEAPPARRRIELTMLWCALAGLAGTAPSCALYVFRYADAMPTAGWTRFVTQVVTFVVVGGAWCGLAVGFGLGFPAHRRARFAAGVFFGAAGAALMGSLGASHFGLMSLPYFGGPAILTSIALAVVLAAAGFAHAESSIAHTALPWWRCAICALAPAPPIVAIVLIASLIEPAVMGLDLQAMRELTLRMGLPLVGAGGGALVGMLGAAWFASSALVAERWRSPTR